MKRVLVLECGLGFGGALTSLAAFLKGIADTFEWEFHVLTAYPQSVIRPGGAVKEVGVLPRKRLYGPHSKLENYLQRIFRGRAGNIAFLLDLLTTGFFYALQVAKYIHHHRIDAVHLNNGTLINDAGILGAKLAGVPCLVHVRGPEYVGQISAFLAKRVNHFMPVSKFVAQTVAALGVTEDWMTVVSEGLDVAEFTSQAEVSNLAKELNLPIGVPVVGMVGCMVPWKGHAVFLDACRHVLENHNIIILIVGDTPTGSPGFRQALERQAYDFGISDHVKFLGHRSDVASIMNTCDIIVHASTSPEPFGRVIIESMALQKAMVATRGGGPEEIVSHGEDGLLVPPGDPIAMASTIEYLIDHPHIRREMGTAGKKKVEAQFSIQRHVQDVCGCYHSLLFS